MGRFFKTIEQDALEKSGNVAVAIGKIALGKRFLALCVARDSKEFLAQLRIIRRAIFGYIDVKKTLNDNGIDHLTFAFVSLKSTVFSCLGIRRGVGSCKV